MSTNTPPVLSGQPCRNLMLNAPALQTVHTGLFGGALLSMVILFIPCSVLAAENTSTEEWDITADKIINFDNPKSIVAKGNVVLVKKEKLPINMPKKESKVTAWNELLGEEEEVSEPTAAEAEKAAVPKYQTTVTIKADWMTYDMELKTIKVKGHLSIQGPEDNLVAKEGSLNLETETGEFSEATIVRKDLQLHLEGETIKKTGYETYEIESGWAVTCKLEDGETAPWSIAASNTKVTTGGYAIMKNARFRIKDVPIFYSPYLILPVKNTRQTGFLMPEFSYSTSGGASVGAPLFINISDSSDATLYPTWYFDRGFMSGLQYRYMTSDTSKGMFTGNFLMDDLSDGDLDSDYYDDAGYTHTNDDRYWIRGKADHTFGDGWVTRLDVDLVSDEDYLEEFDFGNTGYDQTREDYLDMFGRSFDNDSDLERDNSFKVLKSWGGISLETEFLAVDDLDPDTTTTTTTTTTDADTGEEVTTTTTTTEESPLWKLPEVDFDGTLDTGFKSFTFDWDSSYVNYWREDGTGGNRIDIRPALSTPISITPWIESRVEMAVRETYYAIQNYGDASEWEYDDSINRFYPEFEIDTATTLQRDFGFSSGKTVRHEFRPYLNYEYIPDTAEDDELPDWDSIDEITQENTFTYGLDNLFSRVATSSSGMETLSTYGSFLLEQSYYLDDDHDDEPFGDIYSKLTFEPLPQTALSYKAYYDVYDNDFNSHNFEATYTFSRSTYVSTEYSYDKDDDIEQINGTLGVRLFERWRFEGSIEHSLSYEQTNEAKGLIAYSANCWGLKFQTKYDSDETTYMMFFELANIGEAFGLGL